MFHSSGDILIVLSLARYVYITISTATTAVWTDLAKFRYSDNIFWIFVKWLRVYSVFGKLLNLLWQNCNVFGQPFNVVYGQILKNNIATWSHCDNSRLISIHLIRPDTWKLSFSFFLPFLISLSFFLSLFLSFSLLFIFSFSLPHFLS